MNERRAMTLPLLLLLLLAAQPAAADVKLYLKEGGHHAVREFEVKGDRVRFYSTERGDWEEMPLELIDLKKTQAEQRRLSVYAEEQKKGDTAERDAERAQRRELARIPEDAGVYWIDGANVIALQASDVKVVGDKRR